MVMTKLLLILVLPCDDPVHFNHSTVGYYVSGQQHYGSVVTYICDVGYHVSSGVYEYTSYCDMFGHWNVTSEHCQS